MLTGAHLDMELVARFAHRHHLWRREKKQVSIRAQHAAPTPMPVHVLATACHALLCPHLSMATRGPRCHLPSPRVLHSSVLWTWRHRNLFVTLPLTLVGDQVTLSVRTAPVPEKSSAGQHPPKAVVGRRTTSGIVLLCQGRYCVAVV